MRYVIASPPYRDDSAGIRVLYELQKLLTLNGENAIVVNIPFRYDKDDVLVLPECVQPRTFDAEKIIRYYLNKPMEGIDYSKDKISFTFSKWFTDFDELYIDPIDARFNNVGLPRDFKGIYVGKGKYIPIPETDDKDCLLITNEWPPTRTDMADFLNRCSVLYCYDDCTSVALEAKRCGCEVVLVDKLGIKHEYPFYEPDTSQQIQLENFIKKTKLAFEV